MNELTVDRTPGVIAAEINGIKAQTRTILLCSSIEIGRRLVEAKEMIEHGEWTNWLEKSVDYSQRTAQNLMRIFEEYGSDQIVLFGDNTKSQAYADLSYSQAVALLGVPAEEREQFLEENDLSEMTTRELQAAIKERDELRQKWEQAHSAVATITEERDRFKKEAIEYSDKAAAASQLVADKENTVKILRHELELQREHAKSEQDRLVNLLEEARSSGNADEVAALTEKLAEAETQISELNRKLAEPVTVEPTVIEKIPDAIEQELAELRKLRDEQNSKPQPPSPAILIFGVHFESLVAQFQNLLKDLAEIDGQEHEKYRNAVANLIGKMAEKL